MFVGVFVCVGVFDGVRVGVLVRVFDGVNVGVCVGVFDGVLVLVGVFVFVGVADGSIQVWKPSALASGLGGPSKRSYSTRKPDEPIPINTNCCDAPPARVTVCEDSTPPLRTVTGPLNVADPVFVSVNVTESASGTKH